MWEYITSTVNQYWAYYCMFFSQQWAHMNPVKYSALLLAVGAFGWVLMRGGRKQ